MSRLQPCPLPGFSDRPLPFPYLDLSFPFCPNQICTHLLAEKSSQHYACIEHCFVSYKIPLAQQSIERGRNPDLSENYFSIGIFPSQLLSM